MEFFQPLDESILNDCALDMEWLGEHDAHLVALKDLDVTESFPSDNGVPRGVNGHCRAVMTALQLRYECLRLPKKGEKGWAPP